MPPRAFLPLLLLPFLLALACHPDGSSTPSDAGTDAGIDAGVILTCTDVPAHSTCVFGRVTAEASSEQVGAEVQVMGQAASLTRTDEAGNFRVVVDLSRRGIVSQAQEAATRADPSAPETYRITVRSASRSRGAVLEMAMSDDGSTPNVGVVALKPTGSITGHFTLGGRANHSGTQVYVPGTSYLALTNSTGKFTITDVPPGTTYPFVRAEHEGFSPALVTQISVPSAGTVTLDPEILAADAGAGGSFDFVSGDYANQRAIELSIHLPADALLMMLSEQATFTGATWQLAQSYGIYPFTSDGDHTLYAKFAFANGQETAPVGRTINIDSDPRVSLLSPTGATAASRPVLDWSDSRINQARYAVQLATTLDFTSPLVDQVGLTESHLALTTALAVGTTYRWRVAIDDGTHRWNWSAPATFTIDLGAVTLGWPSGTIANSRPTLTWGASSLAGATYNVQIALDRDFGTLVEHAEGLRSTSYPMTTSLAQGQTVFWRVAVVDQQGVVGAYAGPSPITLELGKAEPLLPTTLALLNNPTPSFSWSPNPQAATYTLAYGTAADLSGSTVVSGLTGTSYVLAAALPSTAQTTYYWAVTPVDANGVSGQRSVVRPFTLDTQVPTGTVTINLGATSTPDEVVALSFTASDQSGVSEMYVSRDGSFTDGSWVPYQSAFTLDRADLATTANATIIAHAKFRDKAGNVSVEATDSIALQRTLVSSAVVTAPTTWTAANSPYFVTSNVLFDTTAPLTISPGTVVHFRAGRRVEFRGDVSAVGTVGAPIQLHGAMLWLNYAHTRSRVSTFNPDGSYASGPRFENVAMADGEIHIVEVVFDGPGFYMKNSTLGRVTSGSFGILEGTYIEHSTIEALGTSELNLGGTRVLNSYIATLRLDGYSISGVVEIKNCQLDSVFIDRWRGQNSLEYNNIKQLTWYRPSTTNTAALHNNNIVSTAPVSLRVGSPSDGIGVVNATANYWGSATSEMEAGTTNVAAIFDFYDDTNLVRVDYSGFLTSPVVGAGPNW